MATTPVRRSPRIAEMNAKRSLEGSVNTLTTQNSKASNDPRIEITVDINLRSLYLPLMIIYILVKLASWYYNNDY
jgi:hypothetical protein